MFESNPFKEPCPTCRSIHIGCGETCRFHSRVSVVCMANAEVCRCGDSLSRFARGLVRTSTTLGAFYKNGCRKTLHGSTISFSVTASPRFNKYIRYGGNSPRLDESNKVRSAHTRSSQQTVSQRFPASVLQDGVRHGAMITPVRVTRSVHLLTPANSARTLARSVLIKPTGPGSSPQRMQSFALPR